MTKPEQRYSFPETGAGSTGPENPPVRVVLVPGQKAAFTVTGYVQDASTSAGRHICSGTSVEVKGAAGQTVAYISPSAYGVTAKALTPAGYPPQEGDVWRDSEGLLWFCQRMSSRGGGMGTSMYLNAANEAKAEDGSTHRCRLGTDEAMTMTLAFRDNSPDPDC